MKKYILTAVLCVVACSLHAQITIEEQPYGLLAKGRSLSVQKKVKTVTEAYKARIAEEDAMVADAETGPVRFAFGVPANYTLEKCRHGKTLYGSTKIQQKLIIFILLMFYFATLPNN